MGLNTIEKKCIIGVGILVLLAICCNFRQIKYNITSFYVKHFVPETLNEYPMTMTALPADIKKISQEYNAYKEIYNSDELLLVYGYYPLSVEQKENRIFHKRINELIEERKLNIKVLPYKNWRESIDQTQEDNGKNPGACTLFSADEKDLETIINTTKDCFMNACVIDAKHNRYVSMGKDLGVVIATIEKQLGKKQ